MELKLDNQFIPQNPEPVLSSDEELLPQEEPVVPEPTSSEPVMEEEEKKEEKGGFDPTAPGSGRGFIYGSGAKGESLVEGLTSYGTNMSEFMTAGGAGLYDFMEDAVEFMVPSVDLPSIPEYSNPQMQALRNLYSILGPSWALGGLTRAFGTAGLSATSKIASGGFRGGIGKAARYLEKLGKDRLFSAAAQAGIPIGSGAAVDYINKINQEGDNFFGYLRNQFPDNLKFIIPENLATTSADGPDDRRRKSVLEGAMLSSIAEVVPFVLKYFKSVQGLKDSVTIKTEDTSGAAYQAKLNKQEASQRIADEALVDLATSQSGDDLIDSLDIAREKAERAGLRRMEQLEEMSQLADEIDPAMEQPMLGRDHDQFDIGEQGTMTADPDAVRGAMIDQNDIANNFGTTHGRIRNMVSEAARLKGLEAEELTRRTLVNLVREEIVEAGKFGYTREVGDTKITATYKQIDEQGTALAEYLMDPLADKPFLKGLLSEFTEIKSQLTNLDDVGMNAVGKAIDFWTKEYFNLDSAKASALLQTSMGGQAADLAEGARRFEQPGLIEHAQEEILDRLEFLQVEQAIGKRLRGQALNFLNTWKRVWQLAKRDPKKYRQYLQKEADSLGMDAAVNMKNTVSETKEYFSQLRALAKQDPEMVKVFMLANEVTDGNVHTLTDMAEFFKNNFGVFSKMIIDRNPRYPSVINNAIMSNVYNSILSAPDTANTAGISNAVMLLQKPVNTLVGAALRQDWDAVKRGWYAYSAFAETMRTALGHAAMVFSKLSEDPTQVPYVMRENYSIKMSQQLEAAEELAKVQEARGNFGPRFFVEQQESLEGFVVHPVARIGTNIMGFFDGMTRGVVANGIARYRAYDEAVQLGDFKPESMKAARDKYYQLMQDEKGFLVDPEVDFQAREVSMALDHPVVDGVNQLHKHVPALKVFTMFAKTSINVTGAFWNHSFLSKFAGDYREIVGPTKNYVHSQEEIRAIFEKRGIPIDSNMMSKFQDLQDEIKGRVYVSSAIMGSLLSYVLSDSVHGDGSRDERVQAVRDKTGWARRSIQSPFNGKWYSYDGLGPIADWIAFVANVGDNFDTLGLAKTEELFEKAHWVLAASLTKRQFTQGMEPLLRLMGGKPQDLARFGAQNANALIPLAGLRGDLGKALSDGNAELNNTFEESLLNRNRYLGIIDPEVALPQQRSFIDGSIVGESDNMFDRIFNFLSPIKVSPEISPEKQFLIDIEYDAAPKFLRSSTGEEYTTTQRAEVAHIMGEQLYFRDRIRSAMRMAKDRNFISDLKKARGPFAKDEEGGIHPLGFWSKDLDKSKFQGLFNYLDKGLEEAKIRAEQQINDAVELRDAAVLRERNEDRVKRGLLPILTNK